MALTAGTIHQIQSTATASNVNGGGFNPFNTNMLTDGAATSATGNSPVFSSASYNFVAGDVGHWVFIKSGTNWTPGWYQIASVAANAATLDAAIGSGLQTANNLFMTQTVAGCATTASPTAATWTIDYSQSDSAPFTATDLTGATTNCTSVANPFGKNMTGNIINLNTTGTGGTIGWYEITIVVAGTATLDRSAGTTYSGVTYHTGGALSLGSSDDAVFELAVSATSAASRFFIKGGSNITYTLNGAVSVSAAGDNRWPVIYEGFVSKRGDRPIGATRPILACGSNAFGWGANTNAYSLSLSGTGASIVSASNIGGCNFFNCQAINVSTTVNRAAFTLTNSTTPDSLISSEAISYRGNAISIGATGASIFIYGCNIHDSNNGINYTGSFPVNVFSSIIASHVTSGIIFNPGSSAGTGFNVYNCTLYGAENKLGKGVDAGGGNGSNFLIRNSIIAGFVTGLSAATIQAARYEDYNNYYNNTTDITLFNKGVNDTAINPSFTNIVQRTGSTATTTAGNHLVQSGATFQTWGITPGVDYIYIKSGTGVTAGIYGILSVDSETQITTDITLAADATANKVWQITQGGNYAIGSSLKATGTPGAMPGGLSTGYMDVGAVQRQEAGGGSGGVAKMAGEGGGFVG